MIINLSEELREIANNTLAQKNIELVDATAEEVLPRLSCRLVILPSGAALDSPLSEAAGSMIYGKLLYGGVSRFRLLPSSPPRRAGERTEVKNSLKDDVPCWIQYGGPDRMYEAVDMGPAALLEVVVTVKKF